MGWKKGWSGLYTIASHELTHPKSCKEVGEFMGLRMDVWWSDGALKIMICEACVDGVGKCLEYISSD